MSMRRTSFLAVIGILVSAIRESDGLRCYECFKVTDCPFMNNLCPDAPLEKCGTAGVQCVSLKAKLPKGNLFIIKSCSDMTVAQNPCQDLITKHGHLNPKNYPYECVMCPHDGCNAAPERSLSTFLAVGMICYSLNGIF